MPRKRSPETILAALLRRAVLEHAAIERRRRHVPILHIGVPGEPHEVFAIVADEPTDHALRTDVVAAMRQRARQRGDGPQLVWLTRGGDPDIQDVDAQWHAATLQAYAEAGDEARFVVVGRHGWHDLGTGARRVWARTRPDG